MATHRATRRFLWPLAVLAAAAALPACPREMPPPERPTAAPADGGWERIEPGGRTRCARGGDYAFWVRRGSPERLLVYFQSGGACFDYRTCAPESASFDDSVTAEDDPSRGQGILDLDRPENTFRDHTVVFIPSCTGDVHWGDARTTYRSSAGRRVTIAHRGFVNASAALAWAYRHVAGPSSVFVTGCSAGSVGSAAHAPFVLERYEDARAAQLGDSFAFVFDRPVDIQEVYRSHRNFPPWIPALQKIRPGELTMARWYRAIARTYPEATFAQFNFRRDPVQRSYFGDLGGRPGEFPSALRQSLRQIRRGTENFRSYVAPGERHCILPVGDFFSLEVHGHAVREWVADLAEGRPVPNVGVR